MRKALESEHAQVRAVISDPAVRAEDRLGRIRAINESTIAGIRGLLTDEQKKSYFPPHESTGDEAGPQRSVEDWLNAMQQKKIPPKDVKSSKQAK